MIIWALMVSASTLCYGDSCEASATQAAQFQTQEACVAAGDSRSASQAPVPLRWWCKEMTQ